MGLILARSFSIVVCISSIYLCVNILHGYNATGYNWMVRKLEWRAVFLTAVILIMHCLWWKYREGGFFVNASTAFCFIPLVVMYFTV